MKNRHCDILCRISTNTVHRFKWDSSECESSHYCDKCTRIVINPLYDQSRFECIGVPWMEVKPRFRDPEKVSFPLNRDVPSIGVTDLEIMWTFFQDQILYPLNGGVSWIEASQRRGPTVVEMTFGPVHDSERLPEWQAVKLTFFAPWAFMMALTL